MTGEASAVMASVQTIQAAFNVITAVALTSYQYPATTSVSNNTCYDFIIVGAGTAGCVLANRLSENENCSVLLIESGGYPPIESEFPGLFTIEPNTAYDWNYMTLNDGYSGQNVQNNAVTLTAGKMVGGSTGLYHMVHFQGIPSDINAWAAAVNDESWNYTAVRKYVLKMEKMEDPTILNSTSNSCHGQSGPLRLNRQPSDSNIGILEAMAELGYDVRDDICGTNPFGVCEPILTMADGDRQSAAVAYLSPIRHRTNLHLLTYATVSRILFDSNNVATGVEYVDSSSETYTVCANKEVILSAGAIGSPYILLHSGIGPKSDLEEAGITVRANLPVGENLADHLPAPLAITLDSSTPSTAAVNPHLWPVPLTTSYKDYDGDGSIPDYQVITTYFPPSSSGLLQLCLISFKYTIEICQKMYDASLEKNLLFAIPNKCHPVSKGKVCLNTTEPSAAPLIYHGMLSNSTDLKDMGLYLQDYSQILNTTYFKAVDAKMVDLGLCNDTTFNTTDYWECYAKAMSNAMRHLSGTCSMGKVLDKNLKVYGFSNLRVMDASAMTSLLSGFSSAGVVIIAEKGSDMIKEEWGMN